MTHHLTALAATMAAVVAFAQLPAWASDVLADMAGRL